jgi:ABC-type transport system involved in multi-copper enzyme maturation permease subunit
MKQSNIKIPFVFNLGLVLMCLMLISFSMMGGLYARYSTTATGEATAQIAKFDVQVTGDTTAVAVNVAEVTKGVYTFTITNNSDVTVEYDLTMADEQPAGIVASFDQNEGKLLSGKNVARKLTFTVDLDEVTKSMSGPSDSINYNFTVKVNVEQVD